MYSVCVCIYTCIHTHTYTHTHTHTYNMCVYTHARVHTHTNTHTQSSKTHVRGSFCTDRPDFASVFAYYYTLDGCICVLYVYVYICIHISIVHAYDFFHRRHMQLTFHPKRPRSSRMYINTQKQAHTFLGLLHNKSICSNGPHLSKSSLILGGAGLFAEVVLLEELAAEIGHVTENGSLCVAPSSSVAIIPLH